MCFMLVLMLYFMLVIKFKAAMVFDMIGPYYLSSDPDECRGYVGKDGILLREAG